jgi:hypothetical protein
VCVYAWKRGSRSLTRSRLEGATPHIKGLIESAYHRLASAAEPPDELGDALRLQGREGCRVGPLPGVSTPGAGKHGDHVAVHPCHVERDFFPTWAGCRVFPCPRVLYVRNFRWLRLHRRGEADIGSEVPHEPLRHRRQAPHGFIGRCERCRLRPQPSLLRRLLERTPDRDGSGCSGPLVADRLTTARSPHTLIQYPPTLSRKVGGRQEHGGSAASILCPDLSRNPAQSPHHGQRMMAEARG